MSDEPNEMPVYGRWADVREERRQWRLKKNWQEIESRGTPYTTNNNGVTLLFRLDGKPKCEFYPGTGRWRVAGVEKTFRGGARKFFDWLERQGK